MSRRFVLAARWTCAYFMTKLHILAQRQSQKPATYPWPPVKLWVFFLQDSISSSFCRRGPLAAPPIDGVNFKPSVTPFSCHDDFRGFGWRLCLLLCVFFSQFSFFCHLFFRSKFTYIIVIAVQGILMETVNFFKPQIERK